MHDLLLEGFLMTVILLLLIFQVVGDGLGMAGFWLSECFLLVGMVGGLGSCDFFLVGSVLVYCGCCDSLDMGQYLEKLMVHMWCLVQQYQWPWF